MLTTDPLPHLAPVHDRMPVVLSDTALTRWLDPLTPVADLGMVDRDVGPSIHARRSLALGDPTLAAADA